MSHDMSYEKLNKMQREVMPESDWVAYEDWVAESETEREEYFRWMKREYNSVIAEELRESEAE